MSTSVGDALVVLRRSAGITQEELAKRVNITQAALSRYENDLREPDTETLCALSRALGVTPKFLTHEYKHLGAIAADAHMRRQKTAKPTDWKRIEARINVHRMHTSFLLEKVPLKPSNYIFRLDPAEHTPTEAAEICRSNWRMPIGPVKNLTRWMESSGIVIIEEDFGTPRINGMSQWAGECAVVLINSTMPTDRKRLTLAHELGHLVLHTDYLDGDIEEQANEFAAAFLMPEVHIIYELNNLTLGRLSDLKKKWGVSMQALFERAYRLGKISDQDRSRFYRQLSKRGWRTREPGSDELPRETPALTESIGQRLQQAGLDRLELYHLIGMQPDQTSPFIPPRSARGGLHVV
ncbi:helix-turn-helix domain-containing protein [Corynebacterium antarcticum]|uniref:helix-turn-helix domain-containing protein n=1 Tax=Corynebacterium antarcticum TaxID=2800405 RepID=UPI002005FF6C|nr:ImmA/IrrE family metallo-endopeptidase [Corynebacterium antarcticum]MCK7661999.1 ImmA/IrrE family metallo-endopeptidase [Corynebacterium antarcticum]